MAAALLFAAEEASVDASSVGLVGVADRPRDADRPRRLGNRLCDGVLFRPRDFSVLVFAILIVGIFNNLCYFYCCALWHWY